MDKIDFNWFKNEIIPELIKYEINCRYFAEGDFGSLNQVSIESDKIGCEIDFWSSGVINIFLWDYQKEKQVLNKTFTIEDDESEKKKALMTVFEILQ